MPYQNGRGQLRIEAPWGQFYKDNQLNQSKEPPGYAKNRYLADYLKDHEEKVEWLMVAELKTQYTPVELDRRAQTLKSVAHSMVYNGHSDQEVKDFLKKVYKVDNEEYAQNILEYVKGHPDPDTWY